MRWRVGHLTLDSNSFELRSGSDPVPIEPLVLELLILLVTNRERAVAKKELFETLWPEQHVGESALTRCIYEARKVLGDDAKQQRMIKTIYGRGYRFVGTVVERTTDDEQTTSEPAVPPLAKDLGNTGSKPSPAERSRRIWLWIMAATMAATLAAFVIGRSETPEPRPAPRSATRLAVLPFGQSELRSPGARLAALSLRDQLGVRFSMLPSVVVRALELDANQSQAQFLNDEIEGGRLDAALTATIGPTRQPGRLEVRPRLLIAAPQGRTRWLEVGAYELDELSDNSKLDRFLEVREAIAEDVIQHLGPALGAIAPENIMPTDIEALSLYLDARSRFFEITCGQAPLLLDLLDRSLAIDPQFSLAWTLRGYALYSQAWACGRGDRYSVEALEAVERALTITPDLQEARYLRASLQTERGLAETAYEQLREIERPNSPGDSLAEAYVLRYAGFLDASVAATDRALQLDPLALREAAAAPLALLYLGKVEQFLEQMPASSTPHALFYRSQALHRLGRIDEASEAARAAYLLNPTDLFGRLGASFTAALEGDREAGLDGIRGVIRQRRELDSKDPEMTFKEAGLLAALGAQKEGLERLQEAVAGGFSCPRCLVSDPSLESLRALPGFVEVVEQATAQHLRFAQRFGLVPEDV